MIPDPLVQPVMTIEEAGAAAGLKRSAAYAAARRGEIPTIPMGRRLLVPTAAFRRLLSIDPDDVDAAVGVKP